MSETTNISWATSTGNPWIGCTKVSPGCKNCYAAELDANRFSRTMGGGTKEKPIIHWGKGAPRLRTKQFWKDAVKWNLDAGRRRASCQGDSPRSLREGNTEPERPRIFPSLCDWLDDEVPIEWLADFLKLIHDTPNLDWLLLTKRPENFRKRLEMLDWETIFTDADYVASEWFEGRPPANVWLGVSVEDQKRADERIPELLKIPAVVRFLSVEPLLEKVDLVYSCFNGADPCGTFPGLHWVIVGGESGSNRRDCGEQAIISVAQQCQAAKVPCFVKQDCAFKPGQQGRIPAEIWKLKQFPTV